MCQRTNAYHQLQINNGNQVRKRLLLLGNCYLATAFDIGQAGKCFCSNMRSCKCRQQISKRRCCYRTNVTASPELVHKHGGRNRRCNQFSHHSILISRIDAAVVTLAASAIACVAQAMLPQVWTRLVQRSNRASPASVRSSRGQCQADFRRRSGETIIASPPHPGSHSAYRPWLAPGW